MDSSQSIPDMHNLPYSYNDHDHLTNEDVIHRVESLVEDIVESLESGKDLILSWSSKAATTATTNTSIQKRNFLNISQSRGFASILMILSFVHSLLLSGRTTTTREVYYFFVTHFRSQRECDVAILDTARLLSVSRIQLGLAASPKGWFCGWVTITERTTSSAEIEGSSSELVIDGTAPPSHIQGIPITREWITPTSTSSITSNAKCILVVEKEGIYTRLSEDRFYEIYPCILVTGRGFPDLATRALVSKLYHTLHIPVLGLCDCNPFGISVLQTFTKGSDLFGADKFRYSVPIQWIGLRPSHLKDLQRELLPQIVFQKLTALDKKRMQSLSNSEDTFGDTVGVSLQDELASMLSNGFKLELEALHWLGMDYLTTWLTQRLRTFKISNEEKT